MERDPKWEKVVAFVEEFVTHETLVRFFLEVRVDGVPYISNIIVAKNEIELYDRTYQQTLNKMVWNLDRYIKEMTCGSRSK